MFIKYDCSPESDQELIRYECCESFHGVIKIIIDNIKYECYEPFHGVIIIIIIKLNKAHFSASACCLPAPHPSPTHPFIFLPADIMPIPKGHAVNLVMRDYKCILCLMMM